MATTGRVPDNDLPSLLSSRTHSCENLVGCLGLRMSSKSKFKAPSCCRGCLVSSHRNSPAEQDSKKHSPITKLESNSAMIEKVQANQISLKRGESGYGFTVKGSQPVRIGRVKDASPAQKAGLMKGSIITRLNGCDVTKATAEEVARTVRFSEVELVLEVLCIPSSSSKLRHKSELNHYIPVHHAAKYAPDGASDTEYDDTYETLDPVSELPSKLSHVTGRIYNSTKQNSLSQSNHYQNTAVIHKHTKSTRNSTTRWVPDLSSISKASSMKEVFVDSRQQSNIYSIPKATDFKSRLAEVRALRSTAQSRMYSVLNLAEGESRLGDVTGLGSISSCSSSRSGSSFNSDVIKGSDTMDDTQTTQDISIERQNEQVLAAYDVISCEEDFIKEMHCGMQLYSRPLRRCIITRNEHARLFQNLEKLTAISEYHLEQIRQYEESDTFVEQTAYIYGPRIEMLCEALRHYSCGFPKAQLLLRKLSRHAEFVSFLQMPSAPLSIEEFLEKPLLYLKNLFYKFQELLFSLEVHTSQYGSVKDIVDVLAQTCSQIEQTSDYSSVRDAYGQDSSSSFSGSLPHLMTSLMRKSKSSMSLASVDTEVLQLQSKLVFGRNMEPFQLSANSRHVIYSGEVLYIANSTSYHEVKAVLLSDLLLLCRVTSGDKLMPVEKPIMLEKVIHADYDCLHPAEIMLNVEVTGKHGGLEMRPMLLRALSLEDKCTWRNLLEQRFANRLSRSHMTLRPGCELFI